MGWYYNFKPYVPVARRRANAAREIAGRFKNGAVRSPIQIPGRKIVTTFWGEAWCANLEQYSDFANRLPRGRTYARNGSIMHLEITRGHVSALVSGSELYEIEIAITALPQQGWAELKQRCAGEIGSLVELLQGKLSKAVMEKVTDKRGGMFPAPQEIEMKCSCPDWAGMCKHLAAVMYGIGHRLDSSPELLFELRAVNHLELITEAVPTAPAKKSKAAKIADGDLGDIFGIELAAPAKNAATPKAAVASKPKTRKKAAQKTVKKKKAAVSKAKPPTGKKAKRRPK